MLDLIFEIQILVGFGVLEKLNYTIHILSVFLIDVTAIADENSLP